MNTEKHILSLIQEGNPIPDPDQLSIDGARNQIYLHEINRRNKENTMPEADAPLEPAPKSRPRLLIPVALVLALMIGGAWVLFGESETEVPPATTPTILPVPPTTLPVTTPTTSIEALVPSIVGYWEGPRIQVHFDEAEYLVVRNGVYTDTGTYESLADTGNVTFTTGDEAFKCSTGDSGTYDFVFSGDGNTMLLTTGDDDCNGLRGFGLGTLELSRTVQFALPEEPPPGRNGLEIFDGQAEPGTYENDEASGFRSVIFTSDGTWSCVHGPHGNQPLDFPICGSHEAVFELDGVAPGSRLLVAELDQTPDEALASLRSNDEVIVGPESDFLPTGNGSWSAIVFTLNPVDSVPSRESHCGQSLAPCPLTDLINGANTEATHMGSNPTRWAVPTTQTIWLISHEDGTELVAIAWFPAGFVPPQEDIASHTEAATKVVGSLQFP